MKSRKYSVFNKKKAQKALQFERFVGEGHLWITFVFSESISILFDEIACPKKGALFGFQL